MIKDIQILAYEINVLIDTKDLLFFTTFLASHGPFGMRILNDILVADYGRSGFRFDVSYLLLSLDKNYRVRLTLLVEEITDFIPSLRSIFPCAVWMEREMWDMFGILALNNSDLRRILNDYGFSGHPLRKDFAVEGHFAVYYSEHENRLKKILF